MAGPWEQYQQPAADGPWNAYKAPVAPAPDPTGSFSENFAAGAGKAITDLGRGAKQILDVPAKYLESKFGTLGGEKLGLPTAADSAAATQADVNESRKLDAPLMGTGGGVTGNIAGNVAATVILPGASTLGGATATGAALGALQPTVEGESRALNTAIGGAAGAVGKVAGDKIASTIANRLAAKEASEVAAKAVNAPRDAALAAAKEAGYVVPPRMVQKQGVLGGVLEGFGGKTKIEQLASNKNQEVTNRLARKALGVSDDVPITSDVLKGIRAKAGEAYEALRGAGTITADKQFGSDLAKITQKFEGAAKDFPDLAKNEIGEIVASINKPSFSSSSAIDAISILRDKAAAAFAKGDKSVGSAYRQTSQAMEDAIERNLLETGSQDAVKAFQAARKLIAKTYSIEKALGSSGEVSAAKIAGQLAKGKPLSDELATIGKFAGAFPKAAQTAAKVEPHSVLDIATMAGLGTMGAGPGALIPLARPAARSVVLSDAYQKLMANPEYGAGRLLKGAAGSSEVLKKLLPTAGAVGSLGYGK